jgi:hypothetical protein
METTTNQPTEATTTSKRHYDTLNESIAKMKLTFGNATLPEIFAVMVTVGYTAEKIAGFNSELTALEALTQGQIKEYADQSGEQKRFEAAKNEINKVFNLQRALLRILFKGNIHAWVALQLDSENPAAIDTWTALLNNFYAQLSKSPDLLTAAGGVGITKSSVDAQIKALVDLEGLKQSLRKETSEAQAATDARDAAFDALYPKYAEYIKYAKVLLPDNQLLEAIGVKVKAK